MAQISLAPLYPFAYADTVNGFVKSITSGTGLGKSYSAQVAVLDDVKSKINSQSANEIYIYTAPQHNQIQFDSKIVKELGDCGCEVIKVRPVSAIALSNMEVEGNVLDIVKDLFFVAGNSTNTLFKTLKSSITELIKKLDNSYGLDEQFKRLEIIESQARALSYLIDEKQGEINGDEDVVNIYREQEEASKKERIRNLAKTLSGALTKLCEDSYKNKTFSDLLEVAFRSKHPKSFEQFRAITASFFPFFHVQVSSSKFFLLGMTTAKLMTKHYFFKPRLLKNGRLNWTKDIRGIDELAQTSLEHEEAKEDIRSSIFMANFTFFLDESDAAKEVIKDSLDENFRDFNLLQSIGSLFKEMGDVLCDNSYKDLKSLYDDSGQRLLPFLDNHVTDDSIPRIIAKERCLKIRKSLFKAVSEANDLDSEETFEKLSDLGAGSLNAPYCTVESKVDSEVFNTTSAFGGELFGFTPSRHLDDYSIVIMPSSFRIVRSDSLHKYANFKTVPLYYFFLLITETYLHLRHFSKEQGSLEGLEKEINLVEESILGNDWEALEKSVKSLSGVSVPFNIDKRNSLEDELHTATSKDLLRMVRNVSREKFIKAFSDGREFDEILEDGIHSDKCNQRTLIDTKYSFERGHTIYGVVQSKHERYQLSPSGGVNNVSFPVYMRRMSPERFIVSLVDAPLKRNKVFLMSATGGFHNAHISAFSAGSLSILCEEAKVVYQDMTDDDFALTKLKQDERAQKKTIKNKSFDGSSEIADKVLSMTYRKAKEEDSLGSDTVLVGKFIKGRFNRYKKTEFNNVFSAIENTQRSSLNENKPRFSLALAQTHNFALSAISGALRDKAIFIGDKVYSFEILFGSAGDAEEISAGYGLVILKENSANRYSNSSKALPLLIVFYSASLEKKLVKLLKEANSNPNSVSYKLKELLKLPYPSRAYQQAKDPGFNPMELILSSGHGNSVCIVSAYQSAARGLNLIVDGFKHPQLKSSRNSEEKKQADFFNDSNKKESGFLKAKKRDLDALYVCAPPFYSSIKPPITNSLNKQSAEKRFFLSAQKYIYMLEEYSRQNVLQNEHATYNTEIDLNTAETDPVMQKFFEQQHRISLISMLMQGIGRVERTNAKQEQEIYLCNEVDEIFNKGFEAIFQHQNDEKIHQQINCMSLVNSRLSNGYLSLKDNEPLTSKKQLSPELEVFEDCKSTLLSKLASYRSGTETQTVLAFVEFYKAYRSPVCWTHGIKSYLEGLNVALHKLPKRQQLRFKDFIDLIVVQKSIPIESYRIREAHINNNQTSFFFDNNGFEVDVVNYLENHSELVNALSENGQSVTNALSSIDNGLYTYVQPWALFDLIGNLGELVVGRVIRTLVLASKDVRELSSIQSKTLNSIYELADFYIVKENVVLAIDAKSLSNSEFFGINPATGLNQKLFESSGSKIETIKESLPGYTVKYVILNTRVNENAIPQMKRHENGVFTLSFNSSVKASSLDLLRVLEHEEKEANDEA